MDFGGGSRERLAEESRWAGDGWLSGLLGAREHREAWQGWDDTQCGARQSVELLLQVTCLGRISKRRGVYKDEGGDEFRDDEQGWV